MPVAGGMARMEPDTDRPAHESGPPVGWFDAAVCRNCDAPLTTPYCAECGQKAARRLAFKDIGRETWERTRLFEQAQAKTLGRLILSPGLVARDYVLGKRSAHIHPLKLLVALVAILVLILAANQYFARYDLGRATGDLDRMGQRVMAYANWSFTLGIAAIFLGSWITFRRRGFNAIEHLVLAVYCQNLILGLVIVNLLPTLIWRDPGFMLAHKAASAWYLYAIKLGVVAIGYVQFFKLRPATDWPRLALACLLYLAASWALLRAYAAAILWLVHVTA